jgi:cytochrome c oxidase assembly factor CtaG
VLGVVLVALAVTYMLGWLRLPHRGRIAGAGRATAYTAGIAFLVAAFYGPLDLWAEKSLAAHMVQHHLVVIAGALLLLGRPFPIGLWGLPIRARLWLRLGLDRTGWLRRALRHVTPGAAWALLMLAIVAWHDPRAYDASLRSPLVHAFQHLTLFGASIAFWWHALRAEPRLHRPLGVGTRAVYIMSLAPVSALVGMFLAFSTEPIYPTYVAEAIARGADPLADQQLGGAIMWVNGDMALVFGLIALARDLSKRERLPAHTVEAANVEEWSVPAGAL